MRTSRDGSPAAALRRAGKRIRATYAYNVHGGSSPSVSDHRVRFVLTPRRGEGTLRIRLEKVDRVFWATIRMDGLVTLAESADVPLPSAPVMGSRQLGATLLRKSVEVSFEDLDYRLTLRVGGREVLASSDDADSPAYYGPDLRSLRRMRSKAASPPRVYGEGGAFELTHLVVERDVYYYHDTSVRSLALPWAPRTGWGSADAPILLRQDGFFMLGDNTSASKDSRLWDQVGPHLVDRGEAFQLGTVPKDQLIGKAFFVYWPSGHRLEWLPLPGLNRFGIIPDVGRMRWIR